MKEILCISTSEIKSLKLSLNAYLALIMLKFGDIRYHIGENDIKELRALKWLEEDNMTLALKAVKYFNNEELFEKFYNTFPHVVPMDFGAVRPLRNDSIDTNGARITKTKFKKKSRGSIVMQNKIIAVLEAEIKWREDSGNLKYMNNIDTWLNQNNHEKYEYLLNENNNNKSMTINL